MCSYRIEFQQRPILQLPSAIWALKLLDFNDNGMLKSPKWRHRHEAFAILTTSACQSFGAFGMPKLPLWRLRHAEVASLATSACRSRHFGTPKLPLWRLRHAEAVTLATRHGEFATLATSAEASGQFSKGEFSLLPCFNAATVAYCRSPVIHICIQSNRVT